MRSGLTEQEIESYRSNGFLAIEELLDRSELTQWRDSVDAAIAEGLVQQSEGSNPRVFTSA